MNTILHISDTHFGTEVPKVTRALLELAHSLSPALLVLSGDITQRARPRQFEAAARFVKRMHVPHVLCVPGNHDIPLFALTKRLLRPYHDYVSAFGNDLEPVFESERLLVQGLNSTRWYRHKHGEISDAQIARVVHRLSNARPEQLRVVVTHQPLVVIRERDHNNLLRGHARAVQAFMRAGVDVLLGGHIHLPYVRPLPDAESGVPPKTWVVQAGTAVSHRIREGVANSVNVLHCPLKGPARCEVERWDYSAPVDRFAPVMRAALSLSRAKVAAATAV